MKKEFDFSKLPYLCIHFNGLSLQDKSKTCEAGIRYEDIVEKSKGKPGLNYPFCYPCIKGSLVDCEKRSFNHEERFFTDW